MHEACEVQQFHRNGGVDACLADSAADFGRKKHESRAHLFARGAIQHVKHFA